MLGEIWQRIKYWRGEDRISPENPLTHWRLYFRSSMIKLCQKKFKHFGKDAELRPHVFMGGCSNISIGARVIIRPNSIFFTHSAKDYDGKGSITIEDDVLLGPSIQIFTNKHRFVNPEIAIIDQGIEDPKDVIIKKGSWIGAGTIILPGVTIGRNVVIGAGSVVTKDIPDQTLAVGAPARVIKNLKSLHNQSQ